MNKGNRTNVENDIVQQQQKIIEALRAQIKERDQTIVYLREV